MSFENAEDDFGYCEVFMDTEDTEYVDFNTEDVSVSFDATEELLNNI